MEYAVLKFDGNKYSDVKSSETISSIDNISGIAIIANDTAKDLEENKGLYLGK